MLLSDLYHYFILFVCLFVSISIKKSKLCRHVIKRYYCAVILSRYPFKYSSLKAVIKVIGLGSSFIHFLYFIDPISFFSFSFILFFFLCFCYIKISLQLSITVHFVVGSTTDLESMTCFQQKLICNSW